MTAFEAKKVVVSSKSETKESFVTLKLLIFRPLFVVNFFSYFDEYYLYPKSYEPFFSFIFHTCMLYEHGSFFRRICREL